MKKNPHIKFTRKQVELLLWAAHAGLDQYEKHLLHDEWDQGLSSKKRYERSWPQRKFQKTINLLLKKLK